METPSSPPRRWPVEPAPGPRPITVLLPPPTPSPSSGLVRIGFGLPEPAGAARVEIFDVAGRQVASLHEGPLDDGAYRVTWDGRTDGGRPSGPGVYVVRLIANGERRMQKLIRVR